MMRAVLVVSGTVVGLVSVLSYAPGEAPVAVVGEPATGSAPDPSDTGASGAGPTPSSTASGAATSTPGIAPAPSASSSASSSSRPSATPSPSSTRRASASPTPRGSRTPGPRASHPGPKPTTTSKPPTPTTSPTPTRTPSPTPSPTGPQDFIGSLKSHRYGPVQVGIRVEDGTITDVWAVVAPDGESQDWSDRAVPILRQETLAAQSASIASVTGATLTSNSWRSSLQSALAKAGLS